MKPITAEVKDGSLVVLYVEGGKNPTGDVGPGEIWQTIGFNTLKDTGDDEWKMAGWNWTHDFFTEGSGTVVGWDYLPASLDLDSSND